MGKKLRYYPDDDLRVVGCKKAIVAAGGLSVVGRALGITPQAVYAWEICPRDHCQKLSELSGVPLHILRPDLYALKPQRIAS